MRAVGAVHCPILFRVASVLDPENISHRMKSGAGFFYRRWRTRRRNNKNASPEIGRDWHRFMMNCAVDPLVFSSYIR
ncbi:MAG: hypothetical protein J6E42_05965 [Firmicutes bacterium]|nr:hypothetical protein [Bacillota bacterium]